MDWLMTLAFFLNQMVLLLQVIMFGNMNTSFRSIRGWLLEREEALREERLIPSNLSREESAIFFQYRRTRTKERILGHGGLSSKARARKKMIWLSGALRRRGRCVSAYPTVSVRSRGSTI